MQEAIRISIIIPALNEAKIIASTIKSLEGIKGRIEVIVVDGGSLDDTVMVSREALLPFPSASVITSRPGRGIQLNHGASRATGNVILFLHADTTLPESAPILIEEALQDKRVLGGNFKMACGGPGLSNSVFGSLNTIRRWFGIYYGDSVIWVRRDVFEHLRGFAPTPIMEDYDFCRRLEKAGRTVCLSGTVITSPRRWSRGKAIQTIALWILIQWLYLVGVSPYKLVRLYYPRNRKRFSKKKYGTRI